MGEVTSDAALPRVWRPRVGERGYSGIARDRSYRGRASDADMLLVPGDGESAEGHGVDMHHIIEIEEACPACKGTGVYLGMAERGGTGVVCSRCGGTGRHVFRHEYDDFEGRNWCGGVDRIIACNPGICVGSGPEFGGMPYAAWYAGESFPAGSEMRKYTCPAWWHQALGTTGLPHWDECKWGQRFSDCAIFPYKAACWIRFDQEQSERTVEVTE
jgi:hypothetical protein